MFVFVGSEPPPPCTGASTTDDILKIRLQLTKPVTWIPLIWGVLCGAAASGAYVHAAVLSYVLRDDGLPEGLLMSLEEDAVSCAGRFCLVCVVLLSRVFIVLLYRWEAWCMVGLQQSNLSPNICERGIRK